MLTVECQCSVFMPCLQLPGWHWLKDMFLLLRNLLKLFSEYMRDIYDMTKSACDRVKVSVIIISPILLTVH